MQILQQEDYEEQAELSVGQHFYIVILQEKKKFQNQIYMKYIPQRLLHLSKEKKIYIYIHIPSFCQLHNFKMLIEFPWVLMLKAWL